MAPEPNHLSTSYSTFTTWTRLSSSSYDLGVTEWWPFVYYRTYETTIGYLVAASSSSESDAASTSSDRATWSVEFVSASESTSASASEPASRTLLPPETRARTTSTTELSTSTTVAWATWTTAATPPHATHMAPSLTSSITAFQSTPSPPKSQLHQPSSSHAALSTAEIAGVALGGVAAGLLVIFLIFFRRIRRREKGKRAHMAEMEGAGFTT